MIFACWKYTTVYFVFLESAGRRECRVTYWKSLSRLCGWGRISRGLHRNVWIIWTILTPYFLSSVIPINEFLHLKCQNAIFCGIASCLSVIYFTTRLRVNRQYIYICHDYASSSFYFGMNKALLSISLYALNSDILFSHVLFCLPSTTVAFILQNIFTARHWFKK